MKFISREAQMSRILRKRRAAGVYLAAAAFFTFSVSALAQTPLNACDLAAPFGTIDSADVTSAVNMVLGLTPCSANIMGVNVCDVVVVQRVSNAASTGACITGSSHTVTLTWVASVSPNVSGYNIYRGTTSGGPYATKVNSSLVQSTTYVDTTAQSGQTYYYVATAVDSSGSESANSAQTQAVIPIP